MYVESDLGTEILDERIDFLENDRADSSLLGAKLFIYILSRVV